LATEHVATVERKQFEECPDLEPAPVNALRLKQDEGDQDRPEYCRLQAGDGNGAAADNLAEKVAADGDCLWQQRDDRSPEERAVDGSQAADDNCKKQLNRQDDVESLVIEDAGVVPDQRTSQTGDACRNSK